MADHKCCGRSRGSVQDFAEWPGMLVKKRREISKGKGVEEACRCGEEFGTGRMECSWRRDICLQSTTSPRPSYRVAYFPSVSCGELLQWNFGEGLLQDYTGVCGVCCVLLLLFSYFVFQSF